MGIVIGTFPGIWMPPPLLLGNEGSDIGKSFGGDTSVVCTGAEGTFMGMSEEVVAVA